MEAGREPPRAVHHEQYNSAAAWRPTATRLQPLRRPTPTHHDPWSRPQEVQLMGGVLLSHVQQE